MRIPAFGSFFCDGSSASSSFLVSSQASGTKSENLTTNNGIFLSLSDFKNAAGTAKQTSPQSGSVPWTEERLQIHTGPQTRVLLFSVRRQLSTKLDNLLRGEVWIDAISLRPRK